MSFKIISVATDHVEYVLSKESSSDQNTYTVLIGKNGCGKSNLLGFIADLFYRDNSYFYDQPQLWTKSSPELEKVAKKNAICYYSNNQKVVVGEISKKLTGIYSINTFPYCHMEVFPESLVCVSTSPFDRFPSGNIKKLYFIEAPKNKRKEIYSYVGLKKENRTIKVDSLINSIVHSLFTQTNAIKKNINILEKTLTYLGYGRRIRVSFKSIFTRTKINSQGIDELISNHLLSFYEENIDNEVKVSEQIPFSAIKNAFYFIYDGDGKNFFKNVNMELHLDKLSSDEEKQKIAALDLLLTVNLLKVTSLNLSQKNDNRKFIDFKKASSGEQCIALMLLGIAGKIKNNSLICIDEPEISLHPEWQSSFMSLLMTTFKDYTGCHFIIATHSPQIISELHGENSYILNMDDNKLFSAKEYLSRSADYQLATLFGSPGMHNEFLNRKVVSLLSSLSKNGTLDSCQKTDAYILFNLLTKMNDVDPVKELILILQEALEKISNDN